MKVYRSGEKGREASRERSIDQEPLDRKDPRRKENLGNPGDQHENKGNHCTHSEWLKLGRWNLRISKCGGAAISL